MVHEAERAHAREAKSLGRPLMKSEERYLCNKALVLGSQGRPPHS